MTRLSVLRTWEQQIIGRKRVTCPAYSAQRVGTLPEWVDWSKIGLVPHVYQGDTNDCYVAAAYWNLMMFAKIINRKFYPTFEELKNCDFRHFALTSDGTDPKEKGSDPRLCFQYCMRNGVFSPQKGDAIHRCHNEKAPLSGYARVFPLREDMLRRAVAQQPVLVSMKICPESFSEYTKGYYRVRDDREFMDAKNHFVNAIGYDEKSFKFNNTHDEFWGEKDCTFKIERKPESQYGPFDIHTQALIPVMDSDMTDFTSSLQYANMNVQEDDICYCPKDMESVLRNPHWSDEIKQRIREALRRQ